jgi:hypothetical protein
MHIDQIPQPEPSPQEEQLVWMGGIGYDNARNKIVGRVITNIADRYSCILQLPDSDTDSVAPDSVVFRDSAGEETEVPSDEAMKMLRGDTAELRYTRLHEQRAQELVNTIIEAGGQPVDAIFQSVDTSTGIIAIHLRPDLFKRVILVDPSSIVRLPSRGKHLARELKTIRAAILTRFKRDPNEMMFEKPSGPIERYRRVKRTSANGNRNASYVSYQAQMLHEIQQAQEAPSISIVASRFDYAFNPANILRSLISLDDVEVFFITNTRHGIGGKLSKLSQVVSVLTAAPQSERPFIERLQFAEDVPEYYRQKIRAVVQEIQLEAD